MDDRVLCQVGREVLAPALGGFTQWVLGRALGQGVERLYFLSRDGWYGYQLSKVLCRAWNLPLDCRYLYGSRYAWRLPLYHRDLPGAVAQLCGPGQPVTLRGLLARAGLSPVEQGAVLAWLKLPGEQVLTRGERRALGRELLACPAFLRGVERHSRQALPAFFGYLRQEGLLEPVPWALVDSGWMGTTQETLGQALRLLGKSGSLRGYYAGLYRGPSLGRGEGYFFSPGRGLQVQAGFEPGLFEAVFSAPQGMTLGYEFREGRAVPRLAKASPCRKKQALGQVFLTYSRALAGEQPPPEGLEARGEAVRSQVWERLHRLMASPTRQQAEALGELAFSSGLLEEDTSLAPKLTRRELSRNRLLPRLALGEGTVSSGWLPGSAALVERDPAPWFAAFDRVRWARVLRLGAKAVMDQEGYPWKNGKNSSNTGL